MCLVALGVLFVLASNLSVQRTIRIASVNLAMGKVRVLEVSSRVPILEE
jgi:uncharacterized PurR-regulated membrane protein YhhQ (DUF165 family)